jgi:hypothetical protein
MFSSLNSDALEVGAQTFTMRRSGFGWDGAAEVVACPGLDSPLGSPGLQLAHRGLVQANGEPFLPVGPSELTLAPEPGFLRSDGWLVGDGMVISAKNVRWTRLDSVNLYVSQVEQQLVSFQSDLSQTLLYLNSVPVLNYYSEFWTDEFEDLYSQAVELGVANSRLNRARYMATGNAARACRFLAGEIRIAITEKIAHLRRRLRIAKSLKSKLLRLFASEYEFRNQIVLQRRYYLAHGSHPIENSICPETPRSLDQRGCVPDFPL